MDPVHVPVQLQFSDDSQFISQLLKQQEHSVQESDSNSSASDLNCSDLVQSDGETSTVTDTNVSYSDSVASDKQNTCTSVLQDTIDAQILAQLQSIGQRLTKIESPQCKKSTDSAKIKSTSKKTKHKTLVKLPQVQKNYWQMLPGRIRCLAKCHSASNVCNPISASVLSNVQGSGLNQLNGQLLSSQTQWFRALPSHI